MQITLSDGVRSRLAQSLAVVESHRSLLTAKMQSRMAADVVDGARPGQAEIAAAILTDMLIDGASELVAQRELSDMCWTRREHQSLGIRGGTYSRFGDAFIPIMKDVLGPALPAEIVSAWIDAFWYIVGEISRAHGSGAETSKPTRRGQVTVASTAAGVRTTATATASIRGH